MNIEIKEREKIKMKEGKKWMKCTRLLKICTPSYGPSLKTAAELVPVTCIKLNFSAVIIATYFIFLKVKWCYSFSTHQLSVCRAEPVDVQLKKAQLTACV